MATIPISVSLLLGSPEPLLKIRADKPPPPNGTARPRWKEVLIQNRVLWLEVAVPLNTYRFRVEGGAELASICFTTFTLHARNNEPCCEYSEVTWNLANSREFELKVSHLSVTNLDIEVAETPASAVTQASSSAKKKYKGTVTQNPPILGDSILAQA